MIQLYTPDPLAFLTPRSFMSGRFSHSHIRTNERMRKSGVVRGVVVVKNSGWRNWLQKLVGEFSLLPG